MSRLMHIHLIQCICPYVCLFIGSGFAQFEQTGPLLLLPNHRQQGGSETITPPFPLARSDCPLGK